MYTESYMVKMMHDTANCFISGDRRLVKWDLPKVVTVSLLILYCPTSYTSSKS